MNFLSKTLSMAAVLAATAVFSVSANAQVQQPIQLTLKHVRGTLERLDQQQGVVVVSGSAYPMSSTVRVLDKDARTQPLSAARPGTRVLVVLQNGKVDFVMVNPGAGDFLEGPGR
jgi:hypothetical protein